MVLYILGFVASALLSTYALPLFYSCGVFISTVWIIYIQLGSWRSPAFFILGFLWGGIHHAPPAHNDISKVYIAAPTMAPNGVLIVEDSQSGHKFSVRGVGSLGTYGKVTCSSGKVSCVFVSRIPQKAIPSGFRQKLEDLRTDLKLRMVSIDQPVYGWLCGILLGDRAYMDRGKIAEFKKLGIYHLLIISGLHFTLLMSIISSFLSWPFRLLLASCIARSHYAVHMMVVHLTISLLVGGFYGALVGFSPSVARAYSVFLTMIFGRFIFGHLNYWQKLAAAFLVQSLLFPTQLFSLSTFMSWGAYLILVLPKARHSGNLFFPTNMEWLRRPMNTQVQLALLAAVCLSEFSPWWPLFSVFATKIFSMVLICGLVLIIFPFGLIINLLSPVHYWFLLLAKKLVLLVNDPMPLTTEWRIFCLGILCLLLLCDIDDCRGN